MDAEHVERVIVAQRVLHGGAEEQRHRPADGTERQGAHGPTSPAAGVTATRPAIAPEIRPSSDGDFFTAHPTSIHASPAAAVATKVLISASAAVPLAATPSRR